MKTQLVNSILNNLKIEKDIFSVGMIEDALEGINAKQYAEFFNELMGDSHEFLKPLDRVSKVAKHFKSAEADTLFKDTHLRAKETYTRFYGVNCSMTTYSQTHRDVVKDDRVFFETMDYKNMEDVHGKVIFTELDMYILKYLGGGEWLMNMKFITNSQEVEKKIENIIKNGITKKYLTPKHEAIANNIKKLLA